MNIIYQAWPWYVGGPIVAFLMILLILMGKNFGISSNFRTICAALGGGKNCDFFQFNWKEQRWNLLVLIGAMIGGFIASHYLSHNQIPVITAQTINELQVLGFDSAGKAYAPTELFNVYSFKNIIILLFGGVLIGFGTRYAGGCGASKKIKSKTREETKVELIQASEVETKSIENIVSEIKEEKKAETIIDKTESWLNFEAAEIIVTSKDGITTNIKNPKINKGTSNLNQKTKDETNVVTKDSIVKNEENNTKSNVQLTKETDQSKIYIHKETKQFNFGILALQLFSVGVLVYFCWWGYRKVKKRVV